MNPSAFMLVDLRIRVWSGTRPETELARRINAEHPDGLSTVHAVRRIKGLPGLNALFSVRNSAQAMCKNFTWPCQSGSGSLRLIPVGRHIKLMEIMRPYKERFEREKASMLEDYAKIRLQLKDVWPSVETVAEKTDFTMRFLPLGTGGQWEEWLNDIANMAIEDLRYRLEDALDHIAQKAESQGRFGMAAFNALRRTVDIAGDLSDSLPERMQAVLEEAARMIADAAGAPSPRDRAGEIATRARNLINQIREAA
ncbi:MAG: hypothetical protein QXT45_05010 [Candidatus Bilamarchaeaceae archaeon]